MIEHNLTIYSLNVRATDEAQKDLLRIADQKRIDIVAVQEITGNTGVPVVTNTGTALPAHPTHAEARQHSLKTTIKPSIAPKGYVLASQHSEGQRICFYVRKDLALQHWSCKVHNLHMATLSIQTEAGLTHIHNIYNPHKIIHIADFEFLFDLDGEHVFVGDWNLHHMWWGGERGYRHDCPKAREVYRLFKYEHQMVLLTKQGERTWEKSKNSETWSTIDLVFVSKG
jgi:hypothetical protein